MNKRLRKKHEKQGKEATIKEIHRLLDAALDINGFGKRQQEKSGSLPTIFFEFRGHIAKINICAYDKGWLPGANPDVDEYIGLTPSEIAGMTQKLEQRYGVGK